MFSFLTTATTGKSTRGEYHYIGSGIHIQICRYTSITTNLVYDTPALTDNKMIIIILIVVIIINVACTGNHSPPPPVHDHHKRTNIPSFCFATNDLTNHGCGVV